MAIENLPQQNGDSSIEKYKEDIVERSGGNPGALRVLADIYQNYGAETYDSVAPNLGKAHEIWEKFKDECGEDYDTLIEKYKSE